MRYFKHKSILIITLFGTTVFAAGAQPAIDTNSFFLKAKRTKNSTKKEDNNKAEKEAEKVDLADMSAVQKEKLRLSRVKKWYKNSKGVNRTQYLAKRYEPVLAGCQNDVEKLTLVIKKVKAKVANYNKKSPNREKYKQMAESLEKYVALEKKIVSAIKQDKTYLLKSVYPEIPKAEKVARAHYRNLPEREWLTPLELITSADRKEMKALEEKYKAGKKDTALNNKSK